MYEDFCQLLDIALNNVRDLSLYSDLELFEPLDQPRDFFLELRLISSPNKALAKSFCWLCKFLLNAPDIGLKSLFQIKQLFARIERKQCAQVWARESCELRRHLNLDTLKLYFVHGKRHKLQLAIKNMDNAG